MSVFFFLDVTEQNLRTHLDNVMTLEVHVLVTSLNRLHFVPEELGLVPNAPCC